MKRCGACGEEFESQFSFCPNDGKSLGMNRETAPFDYRPTIISDESLAQRLAIQFVFLVQRFRATWPGFKADPFRFLQNQFRQVKNNAGRAFARPYLRNGLLVAVTLVLCLMVSITLLDKRGLNRSPDIEANDSARTVMIDLRTAPNPDSQSGVGAGENGRVGFDKGHGEGSGSKPARSQGGGSGGDHSLLPSSQGRVPVPSVIPAPIPTTYARLPPQALPAAGIDIDPVLWKDLPFPNYGDPRSKSTVASNGPGNGGGVGTNQGPGIGEGNGPGFGPGT
ncbi:MAG TPA: hypothetical protein VNF70_00460, partial [Pyrinomonadaceae bacterium]|nr:hypothetical protein [Pyrinomonadaceae bacterium]